jgi:NTE family protein
MSHSKVPVRQRALVLQGGGALGAYEAGVFQALYKKIGEKEGFDKLFDIVAGTSSGAMNGAILVSHVIENGTWEGSHEKLIAFWKHVSTDVDLGLWYPYISDIQWNILRSYTQIYPNLAPSETARRYYSTKQFLCSGAPHVYLPEFSTPCQPYNGPSKWDDRFLDNFPPYLVDSPYNNRWGLYTNQPLRESLARFAKFPIATNFDQNQPRLLLVSVDVQESAAVTFDSYPKEDNSSIRESWYGTYNNKKERYEYTISYPDGISLDYAIASGSVPVNYDYAKIADVNKLNNQDNSSHKVTRYFWDGGILSNTPLRELIQWHKDYWFRVKGKEKDDVEIPNLEVYIVDVWPIQIENMPQGRDGALNRQEDLLLNDRTEYDQKVSDTVSDYIKLFQKTREIALDYIKDQNEKKGFQTDLDKFLANYTDTKSKERTGQRRQYKDLTNGRFRIDVKRIQRTKNIDSDIFNKTLDYSTETIQSLIQDGYDEV